MTAEPREPGDLRPGPIAVAAIAAGCAVSAGAVYGALRDDALGDATSWVVWLLGAGIVHDLVVLPVVLGTGWLVWRFCPADWKAPVRTAVFVAAVLVLATWPIARRFGARDDNPSILPLPVGRNLAVMVAALLLAGVAAGAVAHFRRLGSPEGRGGPADGSGRARP